MKELRLAGISDMSAKGQRRIEVLTEVLVDRQTAGSATTVLAVSERQVNRLVVSIRPPLLIATLG